MMTILLDIFRFRGSRSIKMSVFTLKVGTLDVDVDKTLFCGTAVRRLNVVVLSEMARLDPKNQHSLFLFDGIDVDFSCSIIFLVRFCPKFFHLGFSVDCVLLLP